MAQIYAAKSQAITSQEIAHMELVRKLAGECVVLLENDGTLPLAHPGTIALFGTGARQTVKGGTGSGDVNSRTVVSIEQGLTEAGFTVSTKDWLDRYDAHWKQTKEKHNAWIKAEAEKKGLPPIAVAFDHPLKSIPPVPITAEDIAMSHTDTALYVLSRNSGEGADRFCKAGDYLLSPEEEENLRQLSEHIRKVIVVLNTGGIIDISAVKQTPGVSAIVQMAQLGNIGGHVLADVLLGKVNPSGKLTDTWAKDYNDYPSSRTFSHNNGDVHDDDYTDGIYVGYRYFDTFRVEPVYPFGYGLSYTDFSIETKNIAAQGGQISLDVEVANTGTQYSGKEVVQLYVSVPKGELDQPYQRLAVFGKTQELKPGKSQLLTLDFALEDIASYSEKEAAWILERGDYILRVGSSSRNTVPVGLLRLDETVKTLCVKNILPLDHPVDEIVPPDSPATEEKLPVFPVDTDTLQKKITHYHGERQELSSGTPKTLTMADIRSGVCTVEDLTAQLSVKEMAELCVGTMRAEKDLSIVGGASYTVPGAAGDTSGILKESRGVQGLILADGPAGLRLQPHFRADMDGRILPGGDVLGDIVTPFEENADAEDYYQYCTAIPIGWAIAQSWNVELAERLGDMVGEEMEQFHVDLWLAPALNIHRNPLCGRNFEYYSEDPLVSGKIAAAITRGVQHHPGKGTTIKHFAANNQEDNRYFVNVHIRERALREIYLKGFEIAVREASPLSIMTSYNLINGVHAANSRDLLQAVARDEWGFDGLAMTDWFATQDVPMLTGKFGHKYPISAPVGCIYASNDVQMPGCQENVEDIIKAVTTGESVDGWQITLADLQFNAANVIRTAVRCAASSEVD